ncbi:hypothetical protein SCG7086_CU_00010, partial [Chlamydiales bacterium SCGC AG-110-P3]
SYSSITDVLDNLFVTKEGAVQTEEDIHKEQLKLSKILADECPKSQTRPFALFAIDCTPTPRLYANKLEDRSFVHAPNPVPGQDPITVGHQYSWLTFLPDYEPDKNAHWVVPLSVRRVKFEEKGHLVGMQQLEEIISDSKENPFLKQLCVSVTDSAYTVKTCRTVAERNDNWINISRMRSNQVVFRQAPSLPKGQRPKGRPRLYGEKIHVNEVSEWDEEGGFSYVTQKKKKKVTVQMKRLNNVVTRGAGGAPFDVLVATAVNEEGTPLYKRSLVLAISGKRRKELSCRQVYESYGQRFDIEHYFRFGKQHLLNTASQTPDVRHEENWMWISLLAYNMLYHSRKLASPSYRPWETARRAKEHILPPTQVQRDYTAIYQRIGTPARDPKPRGKSFGRKKGDRRPPRPHCPIKKKPEKEVAEVI